MDTPMIFVWPRDSNTGLRHPSSPSRPLPDTGDHWPDDQFTHRRLAEGGIVTQDPRNAQKMTAPVAQVYHDEPEMQLRRDAGNS